MSKKTFRIVLAITWASLLVLASMLLYVNRKTNRVAVIDVIRLYSEFGMKKDLDARVQTKMRPYQERLDSLDAAYRLLEPDSVTRAQELSQIGHSITGLQVSMQESYSVADKAINKQVWMRLNTLIDNYGEEHGYRLLVGANGMGTVLYNEPGLDKTDELITFINRAYEKGN